jgi:tetratricopeptide (TPR) repeat protein
MSATGLRLAATLGAYWHVRSANTEGRAWLEGFLAQAAADDTSDADRITALRWAGELAGLAGDLSAAQTHLEKSLALARQTNDTSGMAAALRAVGSALVQQGQMAAAITPFTEAISLARELGDDRQTAFLLAYLAIAVGREGDLARAETLVTESAELLHRLGDAPSFEANFLEFVQGWLAIMAGDYDRAQRHLEAALALGRALDAKAMLAPTFAGLAEVALTHDEVDAALEYYRQGLDLGWEGDYPVGIAFNLQGLARLASLRDELVGAARLVGVLEAFHAMVRALPLTERAAYDAAVESVQMGLGIEAFTAAREAGRALSLEAAVTEARALADTLSGGQH